MYYVVGEQLTQVEDSPFETRADAEAYVATHSERRLSVLTEAEIDALEADVGHAVT